MSEIKEAVKAKITEVITEFLFEDVQSSLVDSVLTERLTECFGREFYSISERNENVLEGKVFYRIDPTSNKAEFQCLEYKTERAGSIFE